MLVVWLVFGPPDTLEDWAGAGSPSALQSAARAGHSLFAAAEVLPALAKGSAHQPDNHDGFGPHAHVRKCIGLWIALDPTWAMLLPDTEDPGHILQPPADDQAGRFAAGPRGCRVHRRASPLGGGVQ